jgi:tetratricopeptide (TPR) repeat protein
MRLHSFLMVLVIAGSAQAAAPMAGSLELMPAPGPHAVGVKIVQQYDYSRVLEAPVDAFGRTGNAGPGRQLLRTNKARGAVELFKLATYIEPKFANAYDSEGEAYETLGETAAAIAAYEKAVAADKNQVNAIARLKALQAGSSKS